MVKAMSGCEIGCFPSGERMEQDCQRRRVEGVCICHCHRVLDDLPDPVRGYPSLFVREGKRKMRPS